MEKRKAQVKAVIVFTLLVLLCGEQQQKLYGDRKIVEFPFETVSKLPQEPDWYHENAFDQVLYDYYEEKEIQDWFDAIDGNTGVVNKTGDPIPLKSCRWNSLFGLTFYSNNGNLVVVYSNADGQLMRMEVLEKSVVNEEGRYCCILEEIADSWDNSYIDYQDKNTLYYYVNDGNPQVIKLDDGVRQLSGYYLYRCFTTFPILEQNGEIYSYILENAESDTVSSYGYTAPKIEIKKVILSDLEGTCEIKESGSNEQTLILEPDEDSYVWIRMQTNLEEGEYSTQCVFSLLKEDFIKKEPKEKKQYIYLDKSLGYDDQWLW